METGRSYDDPHGIETEYLTSLEGLNRLIKDRHAAGYDRHEHLEDFIILGRWHTDSCGNFGDLKFLQSNYEPMEAPPSLPKVIRGASREEYGLYGMEVNLAACCVPKAHVLCRECGQGWTIDTAHDSHVTTDDDRMRVGGPYVGKTLDAVHADLQARTDGHWFLPSECVLRNDRYIPKGDPAEPKANEQGWLRKEVNRSEHVVEFGDDVLVYVRYYTHKSCWARRTSRLAREEFTGIVTKAGLPADLVETPNRYCKCPSCGPWFVVGTPSGDIVVGWRKRVISIDWSDTGEDLLGLFEAEDVTKDEHHIHAWGPDKAVDYLTRIRGALSASPG
jgi:hypothetical protein